MTLREITVGVDGSSTSRSALRWAAGLAEVSGASLRAVMTWEYPLLAILPGVAGAVPPVESMAASTEAALDEVVAGLDLPVPVETVVAHGHAASTLVGSVTGPGSLIVVGRTGRTALGERLLGSTASHCARHASVPVAVVPEGVEWPAAPEVAVAIDGSERSRAALTWVVRNLSPESRFVAVHAHDEAVLDDLGLDADLRTTLDERAERLLDEIVDGVESETGRPAGSIRRVVVAGDPRTLVLSSAADADLLVLGSQGHSGLVGAILGSLADHALDHVEGPLLIHRTEG